MAKKFVDNSVCKVSGCQCPRSETKIAYQRGRNLPGRAETENFKPDECPKAHVTTKHVKTSKECAMWRLAAQLYPDIKEPR